MRPYWADPSVQVYAGDCLDVLRELSDASVDAVVTDPPYGLGFMGREWDRFKETGVMAGGRGERDAGGEYATANGRTRKGFDGMSPLPGYVAGHPFQQWCEQWATECLRVLKPGGHLLAFGGTRTWHRLACAIEDAGFEIRDAGADLTGRDTAGLLWIYGSGFPKSANVGRAIDRHYCPLPHPHPPDPCAPHPAAEPWRGHGTALKPGFEPIVVARKPLAGTVAANVLAHGTGALNVDGCRVAGVPPSVPQPRFSNGRDDLPGHADGRNGQMSEAAGRWPPNVVLGPDAAAELDRQSGTTSSTPWPRGGRGSFLLHGCSDIAQLRDLAAQGAVTPDGRDAQTTLERYETNALTSQGAGGFSDSGGASRYFPVFRHDRLCALYGMLSVCERTLSESSNTPANIADSSSPTTPGTSADTARGAALTRSAGPNVRAASSAANLCGSCGTAIARSLAPTPPGRSPTRTLGLPSTADSSERTLTRNLALIAADLASNGTTWTTADWTTSLGCAADAISAYTTRASRLAARRSDPRSDFPLWKYEAKAPTSERPRVARDGAAALQTMAGATSTRQCNQCGNRTGPKVDSAGPWPACGHDDWSWVEKLAQVGFAAHPTVKPLALMRWLVRLVTPPGGIVLDPFAGSGTTGEACVHEHMRAILIEREADYLPLIVARLSKPLAVGFDFGELGA